MGDTPPLSRPRTRVLDCNHMDRQRLGPRQGAQCTDVPHGPSGKGHELRPTKGACWKYGHGPRAIKTSLRVLSSKDTQQVSSR